MAKTGRRSKTAHDTLTAREREVKAFTLRKAGATYDQIGAVLGVTKQGAHKAVMRALKRLANKLAEDGPAVRRMELERLDAMQVRLWVRMENGDDKAFDAILKIMDRRARYLGLNHDALEIGVPMEGNVKINVYIPDNGRKIDDAKQASKGEGEPKGPAEGAGD